MTNTSSNVLERRIRRLEKLVFEASSDFARQYKNMEFEDAADVALKAVENGDIDTINMCAKVGRTDFSVSWFVKQLLKQNTDRELTKVVCKLILPIIKHGSNTSLWDDNLKLLNKTDNRYLIDFLIENGYADEIVGRGRRVSPLIKQALEDSGMSYSKRRKQNRKDGDDFVYGHRYSDLVRKVVDYIERDIAGGDHPSLAETQNLAWIARERPDVLSDQDVLDAVEAWDNDTADLVKWHKQFTVKDKHKSDVYDM